MFVRSKKGSATIGDYVIGVFLFLMILVASFAAYSGFIVDYDSTVSTSFNQSKLDRIYANASTVATTAEENSKSTPDILGLDILVTGLDSIKTGFAMYGVAEEAATFVETETVLKELPASTKDTFRTIIILTAIFITIGAIWRYNMKK